jgi:hypothetical protein
MRRIHARQAHDAARVSHFQGDDWSTGCTRRVRASSCDGIAPPVDRRIIPILVVVQTDRLGFWPTFSHMPCASLSSIASAGLSFSSSRHRSIHSVFAARRHALPIDERTPRRASQGIQDRWASRAQPTRPSLVSQLAVQDTCPWGNNVRRVRSRQTFVHQTTTLCRLHMRGPPLIHIRNQNPRQASFSL